jgi:hypothetical protein
VPLIVPWTWTTVDTGQPRSLSDYREAPRLSRGATALPRRPERWGVWGAMSGPPMFTVTEEEPMKAIVFEKTGGPEVLALADVPQPDVRDSRWAS